MYREDLVFGKGVFFFFFGNQACVIGADARFLLELFFWRLGEITRTERE